MIVNCVYHMWSYTIHIQLTGTHNTTPNNSTPSNSKCVTSSRGKEKWKVKNEIVSRPTGVKRQTLDQNQNLTQIGDAGDGMGWDREECM